MLAANQWHAAAPSGCASIPQFIFLIMMWSQFGNVSDICAGDEDFEKISDVHTYSIILFVYNLFFVCLNKPDLPDFGDDETAGVMRP